MAERWPNCTVLRCIILITDTRAVLLGASMQNGGEFMGEECVPVWYPLETNSSGGR